MRSPIFTAAQATRGTDKYAHVHDGDPTLWKIVGDRLYLNLNEEIQNKWSEDIVGNIRKANARWSSISGKPVGSL